MFTQHKCGTLGAVGHREEFDPVVGHRAKMDEKDTVDKMGVYDIVPRSDAAAKGLSGHSNKVGHGEHGVRRQASVACKVGSRKSFVARKETSTSTPRRRLIGPW